MRVSQSHRRLLTTCARSLASDICGNPRKDGFEYASAPITRSEASRPQPAPMIAPRKKRLTLMSSSIGIAELSHQSVMDEYRAHGAFASSPMIDERHPI